MTIWASWYAATMLTFASFCWLCTVLFPRSMFAHTTSSPLFTLTFYSSMFANSTPATLFTYIIPFSMFVNNYNPAIFFTFILHSSMLAKTERTSAFCPATTSLTMQSKTLHPQALHLSFRFPMFALRYKVLSCSVHLICHSVYKFNIYIHSNTTMSM